MLADVFSNTLARVKPIIHDAVISPLLWIPAYLLTTYGVDYVKLVHVLEINSRAPDTPRHKHLQEATWFVPDTTSKTQNISSCCYNPGKQQNKTEQKKNTSVTNLVGWKQKLVQHHLRRLWGGNAVKQQARGNTKLSRRTFTQLHFKGHIVSWSRSFCQKQFGKIWQNIWFSM